METFCFSYVTRFRAKWLLTFRRKLEHKARFGVPDKHSIFLAHNDVMGHFELLEDKKSKV